MAFKNRFRSALVSSWGFILVFAGASSAISAESPYFEALLEQRLDPFQTVPAYRTRAYLHGAATHLKKLCPVLSGEAEKIQDFRVVKHLLAWGIRKEVGDTFFNGKVKLEDAAFFQTAPADEDIKAYVKRAGCDLDVHRAWLASAHKLISETLLVADFSSHATEACQKYRQMSPPCDCFAQSFDMETSPAQRKRIVDQKASHEVYHDVLTQGDFLLRVARNCAYLPDLVSHAPNAPQMIAPKVQIALGRYVVRRESTDGSFEPYGGYCDIEKDRPNRFPVKCRVGGTFDGFGMVENDKFIVRFPKGVYRYQMQPDGSFLREGGDAGWTETLTMQSETNRPEMLPQIPQVRRTPPKALPPRGTIVSETDRDRESKARYCAGFAKSVAGFKARIASVPPDQMGSTSAQRLIERAKTVQRQYEEKCGP